MAEMKAVSKDGVEVDGYLWTRGEANLKLKVTQAILEEVRQIIALMDAYQEPWKPGQRVVHRDDGAIYELVSTPSGGRDWVYRTWNRPLNKWWDIPNSGGAFPAWDYEPWPRIGDWVRCKWRDHEKEGLVFQVKTMNEYGVTDGNGTGLDHAFEHLEPAEPPKERAHTEIQNHSVPINTYSESSEEIKAKSVVYREQSKPADRFTGPHWDRLSSFKYYSSLAGEAGTIMREEDKDFMDCILDLRDAVRELLKSKA